MNNKLSKTIKKKNTIEDCILIDIPTVNDYRGNLAVIEKDILPFKIKRVYYLFDIPTGAYRGAHAHKEETGFVIALSGSFKIKIDDGINKKEILLHRPNKGLLLPPGIWRELKDFSQGSVCLVINSHEYNEHDYIRDYNQFLNYFK